MIYSSMYHWHFEPSSIRERVILSILEALGIYSISTMSELSSPAFASQAESYSYRSHITCMHYDGKRVKFGSHEERPSANNPSVRTFRCDQLQIRRAGLEALQGGRL